MFAGLFPVTSVKKFLYGVTGFAIFHLSEAGTGGVLLEKVFLEISQNSQENTYDKVSFNKVTGWGDCFWTFSCLLLKVSCLFHFNRKMKWKKGNTLMELGIYFFARVTTCLTSKISKDIWLGKTFFGKVLLGKSFWVVNIWRAPVRKRLKGSTLNFAHTFLMDCCTKRCLHFS